MSNLKLIFKQNKDATKNDEISFVQTEKPCYKNQVVVKTFCIISMDSFLDPAILFSI